MTVEELIKALEEMNSILTNELNELQ